MPLPCKDGNGWSIDAQADKRRDNPKQKEQLTNIEYWEQNTVVDAGGENHFIRNEVNVGNGIMASAQMLASIIKFSSIPPHQISWDYQGCDNSKLLKMNHFSNYITPTSVFLVSLTNTITANRGIASLGVKLTPGSFWEWWEQLPTPWKSQKEKNREARSMRRVLGSCFG